jgi:hypothetical protein
MVKKPVMAEVNLTDNSDNPKMLENIVPNQINKGGLSRKTARL